MIADDHPIVRRGIKDIILEAFPSAEIVGVCNAEELIQNVIKEEWDAVISDLSMPGRTGLEALQQIKMHSPKLPVLILSMHSEDQYALRVLKAGAAGYLNKDMAPDELVNAINKILSGRKYITPSVGEKLAYNVGFDSDKPSHELLSDREFEVLKLIAAGKAVTDIGALFFLSTSTVSTYRSRILTKMNLKTNADLTQYAIEHKLI